MRLPIDTLASPLKSQSHVRVCVVDGHLCRAAHDNEAELVAESTELQEAEEQQYRQIAEDLQTLRISIVICQRVAPPAFVFECRKRGIGLIHRIGQEQMGNRFRVHLYSEVLTSKQRGYVLPVGSPHKRCRKGGKFKRAEYLTEYQLRRIIFVSRQAIALSEPSLYQHMTAH